MIVAFSTSSPIASVALIELTGDVIASDSMMAPMRASGACLMLLERLLKQTGLNLKQAELFAADLGPGSFTGVKVAVTVAKAMAFAQGVPVAGMPSFDLIASDRTAVLPSKRREWFIRKLGSEPYRSATLPTGDFVGYGPGIDPASHPLAANFGLLFRDLKRIEPEALLPNYLIEPSISVPKKPLSPLSGSTGA